MEATNNKKGRPPSCLSFGFRLRLLCRQVSRNFSTKQNVRSHSRALAQKGQGKGFCSISVPGDRWVRQDAQDSPRVGHRFPGWRRRAAEDDENQDDDDGLSSAARHGMSPLTRDSGARYRAPGTGFPSGHDGYLLALFICFCSRCASFQWMFTFTSPGCVSG